MAWVVACVIGLAPAVLQAETLAETYQLALKSDPVLAASEAQYRATLTSKPQARSALLPQVNAQAAYYDKDTSYKDASPFFEDSGFNRMAWGIGLDQTLFNRQAWVKLSQADIAVAEAEARIIAERQSLIVRTAEAYLDVLSAQDTLEFARAEKEAITRQLEQTEERFRVGMIAITDVKESQAQADLAVAQEIDAQNQLDIAREQLNVIAGEVGTLQALDDNAMSVKLDPATLEAWVDQALESSMVLKASELALEGARKEVVSRRAGHYPSVGLTADYGVQDDSGGFSEGETTDITVGVELLLPIYSGGLTSARVGEAKQLADQVREQYELQKRQTISQTRASYLSVVSGRSRVSALHRALESTQTAATATETGFKVGTRTSVDVLLALRETYRAQRDYSRARYDYLLSTLRLKQAAGVLSEQDLSQL